MTNDLEIRHCRALVAVNDHGGVSSLDLRFSFCPQCSHCEGHRDSVVAKRIQRSSVQFLAAGNSQTVVKLFYLSTHQAQVGRDARDSVGFRLFPAKTGGRGPAVGGRARGLRHGRVRTKRATRKLPAASQSSGSSRPFSRRRTKRPHSTRSKILRAEQPSALRPTARASRT